MGDYVLLYPTKNNVGERGLKGWKVPANLALKFIKTKLWSAAPIPKTEEDVANLLNESKTEILAESAKLDIERKRLIKEREELEALRAELLTGNTSKMGRPKKTEV